MRPFLLLLLLFALLLPLPTLLFLPSRGEFSALGSVELEADGMAAAAPVMRAVSAVLVRRGPAGRPFVLWLLLLLLFARMLRVIIPGEEPSLREGDPSEGEAGLGEPPSDRSASLSSWLVVAVISP